MLTPTKPVKSCECGGSCGDCCCCTKESIGLGNVDNTSDLNKPLSTDMINALSGKVDLDIFTQLKNRVLALENSIPDITSLENRITNAEANIVTLQSNYANLSQAISNLTATVNTLSNRVTGVNDALVTVGTRVDALEAKDSNNVKLSGVNVQTIQGTLKANDPASGATDKTLVTANWVSQTGGSAPNNLLHKSGNETKNGTLKLTTTTAGATCLKVEQTSNGPIIAMYALNYDLNQHEKPQYYPGIYMFDKNEVRAGGLYLLQEIDGRTKIIARVRNADGTTKEIAIAVGD